MFRLLMNRTQSKDHRRGTCEIKKISLSCFDDNVYNQTMDVMDYLLARLITKSSYLNSHWEELFCQENYFNF